MESNRAPQLRTCSRPPSLYSMSSGMVLQSFGERPIQTLKCDSVMRTAAPSGSRFSSLRSPIRSCSSSSKAPDLSVENGKGNDAGRPEIRIEDTANSSRDSSLAALWASLPSDMQALVLSNLPFMNLIALRRVCKKWNDIVLSMSSTFPRGSFQENRAPKCVPLHFEDGFLALFNSEKNAWEEQPLGFLRLPPESLHLEASSRGLLCFQDLSSQDFIVCNPITRRWRRVPLPPGITHNNIKGVIARSHRPVPAKEGGREAIDAFLRSYGKNVAAGIINDTHSKSYKLIVAGIPDANDRDRGWTLLFDSVTSLWTTGADVPRGARFWESGKVVHSRGYFYCLTYSVGLPKGSCALDEPWSVIRYDVGRDVWSQVKIVERGTVLPQLAEHKGRVLLLQRQFSQANQADEISFSEVVEEDESGTASWAQAKTVPLEFFSGDKARSSQIIEDWCVGQGGLLYVAGQEQERDGCAKTKGRRSLAMLAHDFALETWIPLPTLSLHGGYYPARSLHVLEPSLTAQP